MLHAPSFGRTAGCKGHPPRTSLPTWWLRSPKASEVVAWSWRLRMVINGFATSRGRSQYRRFSVCPALGQIAEHSAKTEGRRQVRMEVVKRPAVLCFISTQDFFLRSVCCPRRQGAQQNCGAPALQVLLMVHAIGLLLDLRATQLAEQRALRALVAGAGDRRPLATFSSAAATAKKCGFACSVRQGSST
jgi:hypothetical protein